LPGLWICSKNAGSQKIIMKPVHLVRIVALAGLIAHPSLLSAQTFHSLHIFTHLDLATNRDGAHPETGLLLSGGALFGTAQFGGNAYGTVFSLAIVPGIASVALAGTNVVFQGSNAVAGENCSVLASGDLTLPLNQWTPVAAVPLATNGGHQCGESGGKPTVLFAESAVAKG